MPEPAKALSSHSLGHLAGFSSCKVESERHLMVLEDECPSKIISLKRLILTAPACQECAQPCQGRRGASFP